MQTSDGVPIAVSDWLPDGPVDVFLLHGLCLTRHSWQGVVRRLRQPGIRVVYYDHRGHGSSGRAAPATYSPGQLAQDLAEIVTTLRISGPLTMAGHSMGGMAALSYLARAATEKLVRPCGLVLVATAAAGLTDHGIARVLALPGIDTLLDVIDHVPHTLREQVMRSLARPLHDAMDDIEIARVVWIRITQARAHTTRPTGTGWKYHIDPAGSSTSMPGYLEAYVDRMAAAAKRLHHVSLECRPAIEVVRSYGAFAGACLYVDPPYLGSTRTDGGNGYRVDMRDLDAHAELLDELLACRASVVLSGYASDLYDHTLAEWSRIEIPTGTAQGGTYQTRTEVIWSNRPIGEQPALFDVIQQLSGGSPETAFKPRTDAVTYRSPTTCTEEEIR
ncbi:alpha/beta hydrolase fold protein [Mycolicibacterium rhodesiae JS60]|nr:alpha/beta hydrolase fold protein [Mycolicibacterium rhodesiae JS60]